jgi:hypothetical protein
LSKVVHFECLAAVFVGRFHAFCVTNVGRHTALLVPGHGP